MIPFINLGVTACAKCRCRIEFDITLGLRRKPKLCVHCKAVALAAREKARRGVVKQRSAAVDTRLLETLAVRSYDEVASIMGISSETVRKVEQRALEKMRKNFAALRAAVQAHLRPETRSSGFRVAVRGGE